VASYPLTGGLRVAAAVTIGLSVVLAMLIADYWTTPPPASVFDADELSARSPAPIGRDVIVTGTWTSTAPAEGGHLCVVVSGHKGGHAVCHFESVAVADRSRLERRLVAAGDVAIRGRCESITAGVAVLRQCRLLD